MIIRMESDPLLLWGDDGRRFGTALEDISVKAEIGSTDLDYGLILQLQKAVKNAESTRETCLVLHFQNSSDLMNYVSPEASQVATQF